MVPKVKSEVAKHEWPSTEEHVWGDWMQFNSSPPYLQYRTCVHLNCSAHEKREAPRA